MRDYAFMTWLKPENFIPRIVDKELERFQNSILCCWDGFGSLTYWPSRNLIGEVERQFCVALEKNGWTIKIVESYGSRGFEVRPAKKEEELIP